MWRFRLTALLFYVIFFGVYNVVLNEGRVVMTLLKADRDIFDFVQFIFWSFAILAAVVALITHRLSVLTQLQTRLQAINLKTWDMPDINKYATSSPEEFEDQVERIRAFNATYQYFSVLVTCFEEAYRAFHLPGLGTFLTVLDRSQWDSWVLLMKRNQWRSLRWHWQRERLYFPADFRAFFDQLVAANNEWNPEAL